MNSNPFSDAFHFLSQGGWTTAVYWLLLLGSVGIAIYAYSRIEGQRSPHHLANWVFRFLIGSMWWQQTLWKLPPYYTDHPSEPFGATGLAYWMGEMGKGASFQIQADLVNNVILPHFYLFAPVVYGLEVLTAVALMFGVFVRLMGVIGALQILNLWLGLYNAQGEWPWTYFFLLVLQVIFALHQYGRSLGVDVILVARSAGARQRGSFGATVLGLIT